MFLKRFLIARASKNDLNGFKLFSMPLKGFQVHLNGLKGPYGSLEGMLGVRMVFPSNWFPVHRPEQHPEGHEGY